MYKLTFGVKYNVKKKSIWCNHLMMQKKRSTKTWCTSFFKTLHYTETLTMTQLLAILGQNSIANQNKQFCVLSICCFRKNGCSPACLVAAYYKPSGVRFEPGCGLDLRSVSVPSKDLCVISSCLQKIITAFLWFNILAIYFSTFYHFSVWNFDSSWFTYINLWSEHQKLEQDFTI